MCRLNCSTVPKCFRQSVQPVMTILSFSSMNVERLCFCISNWRARRSSDFFITSTLIRAMLTMLAVTRLFACLFVALFIVAINPWTINKGLESLPFLSSLQTNHARDGDQFVRKSHDMARSFFKDIVVSNPSIDKETNLALVEPLYKVSGYRPNAQWESVFWADDGYRGILTSINALRVREIEICRQWESVVAFHPIHMS